MNIEVRPAGLDEAALVHEVMIAAFAEYEARLGLGSSALLETVDDVRRHMV